MQVNTIENRIKNLSLFKFFAVVVVPLSLVIFSIVALFQWPNLFVSSTQRNINFQVVSDELSAYSPAQAFEKLKGSASVGSYETKLVESPFWLLIPSTKEQAHTIELPSRHSQTIECFASKDGFTSIGKADKAKSSGALMTVKAGYAIANEVADVDQVLCRATFKGPAQITVLDRNKRELSLDADAWNRYAGLLEGGMLTLALFVLVVAVINRHLPYFVFSLWLVFNYRVAAISAGWDANWLGHAIPVEYIYPIRQIAISVLGMLTIALMSDLFSAGLKKIGKKAVVGVLQISAALLLAAAFVLDFDKFLPVMWVVTAFNISVIGYLLISVLIATHSRVAMWFAASMGVMLFSSIYEIVAASFGIRGLSGAINSVTASLASSLLAALAIAEHLRKARSDHVKTYRVSPVGLATIGLDGQVLRMNQAFAHLAGTKVEKSDEHWDDFFPADVMSNMRDELRGEEGPIDIVFCVQNRGSDTWYELTAISTDDGNVETSLTDITERKLANDRLHWLADHDPLTSLLNRRGLDTALAEAVTALSQGRKAALAYIDLNRFKLANDLYGHSTGDTLLKQVTQRLTEQLTSGETIARVGGDEFVVVFADMQLARAKRRCEELLDAICHPLYQLSDDGRSIRLSAALGLVEMSQSTNVEDSIAAADQACRAAKRDSGAGLVVYPQESSAFGERLAELKLIKRMDTEQGFDRLLRLNFQPLLRLNDPFASLDFEVLLRANDPSGMPIPAYRIISSAEKAGHMQRVDLWVLETTLRFLEAHPQELGKVGLACVNLSGASLNDENFVANVGACLRNYPTVSKKICFEITEAVALHDLANTRRWIDQQRHEGAKVALDDFGAGYSSFAYLRELPADALKIDGAFVRSMARHASNQSIVQVMIDLAHNLGMSTVAECVEDLSTMSMLWELGADYLQGFVLAKPMSADDLLRGTASWELITDPHARKLIIDTSGLKPPPPVRLAT